MIVVKAAYDSEAQIWFVESSALFGLHLEAATLEQLRDKLPGAVIDLLEAAGEVGELDIPIELIAHASTRARSLAA